MIHPINPPISLLHTADWHLGATLYGQRRHDEQVAFCKWLVTCVQETRPDVFLLAGDIFDTTTPSPNTQTLYYETMAAIQEAGCPHIVVIGGNHDSPTLLNAIRPLVSGRNVHIIGNATETPHDEIIVLKNPNETPFLIICAIPYLRDRDVRLAETHQGKTENPLLSGIATHYATVATIACQLQKKYKVPIVGMGHLFASGGISGEGVRELYIGHLGQVGADIFPSCFDYVALGHLHVPQAVAPHIRYSGAPIHMGFGETYAPCLLHVTLSTAGTSPTITSIPIPVYQPLITIKGNWDEITAKLHTVVSTTHPTPPWLDVVYTGNTLIPALREKIETKLANTSVKVLRVKSEHPTSENTHLAPPPLHELTPEEVFVHCLQAHKIPAAQWPILTDVYRETLYRLHTPCV